MGTFYVNSGKAFVLGTEPSCAGNTPLGESGFVQPWIQFGRTEDDFYYGICSFAIPSPKEDMAGMLELIYSEFNTGQLLGTPTKYQEGAAPSTSFKLKIFDEQGIEFENVNFLVERDVGESFSYRGDPRLFHFPDGVMGLFMERTGKFYTVTEKMLYICRREERRPTIYCRTSVNPCIPVGHNLFLEILSQYKSCPMFANSCVTKNCE